jgi:CheY-like chemotaxis protein
MEPTILIIDDSEDDILLTKMVLAKVRGEIGVTAARDGEEGLALLRNGVELPALVLLDLKMPRMGGLDVLSAIRNDDRLRRMPVIIVTHSDLESDKEASYKSGANGYLNKSVDLDQFMKHIRSELEKWI